MYLDLALEGTARGVIEANLANLRHAAESREGVSQVATMVMLALRMAGLSFGSNQELLLTCSSFQVEGFVILRYIAYRLYMVYYSVVTLKDGGKVNPVNCGVT